MGSWSVYEWKKKILGVSLKVYKGGRFLGSWSVYEWNRKILGVSLEAGV